MWSLLASLVGASGYCCGGVIGCFMAGMTSYNGKIKDGLLAGHVGTASSGTILATCGYVGSKLILQAATLQPIVLWKTPLVVGMLLSHSAVTFCVAHFH